MTLAMDTTGLLARYLEGPTHAVALRAMAADPDWCASALVLSEAMMLIDRLGLDGERSDELRRALRDDWDEADYCACEWSDPNTADPYECVAYDLRLLAEETDPDPRHTGGLVRHRTNYALAGFDYLTFAA